ncbi:MAG: hypothetical protein CME26_07845 [Gemmatimonadetes bacterium]|nr:hypothetical protein [Gemmatimonadota bacterium]
MITPRHHLAAFALACLLATPASAKWLTYPEGLAHADSTGTLVLVEVYTDWCSYCKKLERRVLSRDDIKSVIAKHFTPVKLDAEDDTPVAQMGDTTLTARQLARRYGATTYPTVLILSPKGQLLTKLVGYLPPKEFLDFLSSTIRVHIQDS